MADITMNNQATESIYTSVADKSKDALLPRVRRRNRMITSCLECRRRKLKCDKQQPCTNCQKFSRDCMFLAPALDSVSQKKLNEIKEKMGSLERTLEEDVARRKSDDRRNAKAAGSSDLPGEGSESDDGPIPEDERGLEATPLATVDATYEDNDGDNDDVLDLGFRVGKFRMSERLGGLFRPKLAEEMVFALVRDNKRGTEPEAALKDDQNTFLDPGPTFIAPGSGFLFGETASRRNILDFLPTKGASDLLIKRYHINCHFLARVVHWPTFQIQYDSFWSSILAGIEPPASLQALVFAVFFSAVASMSNSEVDCVFQQSQRQVLSNFQQATEVALGKANVLRTTKIDTLQALIVYLIPMCRGEISRAHSVLVGAAIRLAECFGLHRDPVEVFGLTPVDAHVRRLAWFQLCFLDFRTAEAQGPRPSIKREDYDTKLPWNLDDVDLMHLQPSPSQSTVQVTEKVDRWTDMTLSKIRFECNEMHRIVWHDRIRLDKQRASITHVLGKIESFRNAMETKYKWLDVSITVQHYARLVLDLLLLRMHIMVLHKYHNATSTRIPDRLRQIIINSGTQITESAVKLDTDPKFDCFKWYGPALQQWHTAFLLLTEVFVFPNRKEADRIWSVIDHVFEPDLTLTRVQKARSILGAVRDRAAAYRNVRKMREPVSMRNRLAAKLPARGRIRGPEMILPVGQGSDLPRETEAIYQSDRPTSQNPPGNQLAASDPATSNAPGSAPPQGAATTASSVDHHDNSSWSFDTPYTFYMRQGSSSGADRANLTAAASPKRLGTQHPGEPSPSTSSSLAAESWPPNISSVQEATYQYKQNATSPPLGPVSPPEFHSSSPPRHPGLYGNSAMGLGSGQYIRPSPSFANTNPATNAITYGTSRTPSVSGPLSSGQQYASSAQVQPNSANAMRLGQAAQLAGGAPTQLQAHSLGMGEQDMPMLDIDWSEWDKLFPLEMNNGELDMPIQMQSQAAQ